MGISIRRVNALVFKEIKDMVKNSNILVTAVLPILAAVVFSMINVDVPMKEVIIMTGGVSINLNMVSAFFMAMIIAEEKEKNTLRTLMLSGVSSMDFLLGKAVVSFIVTLGINVAIFFIAEIGIEYLLMFIVLSCVVSIIMIIIGAIIGMMSPNQMATGVVGSPILILLYLIPSLEKLNDIFMKISRYLPFHSFTELFNRFYSGKGGEDSIFEIIVLAAWLIVSLVVFAAVYKRKSIDK